MIGDQRSSDFYRLVSTLLSPISRKTPHRNPPPNHRAEKIHHIVVHPAPAAHGRFGAPSRAVRRSVSPTRRAVDRLRRRAKQAIGQAADQPAQQRRRQQPRAARCRARSPPAGAVPEPIASAPARSQHAIDRDTARCAWLDGPPGGDQPRRAWAEHADLGGPGVGSDSGHEPAKTASSAIGAPLRP